MTDQSILSASSFASPIVSSTPWKRSGHSDTTSEVVESLNEADADDKNSTKQEDEETIRVRFKPKMQGVRKYFSKQEWLSDLNEDFINIVVGGLEVGLRTEVSNNIYNKKIMTPKQNMALVHSVNHHIYLFIGKQRPDSSLCR